MSRTLIAAGLMWLVALDHGCTHAAQPAVPIQIIWGREDDVFDHATFSARFKQLLPHAEGPHLVTGRHFLQEDSGPAIGKAIAAWMQAHSL